MGSVLFPRKPTPPPVYEAPPPPTLATLPPPPPPAALEIPAGTPPREAQYRRAGVVGKASTFLMDEDDMGRQSNKRYLGVG